MTRYELLDRIGVGGMAEIFRGKAVAAGGFEKPVAIKRILGHLSQDPRFVELLIAEAKILSLLKHRNIVQIFDVGLGDDGKYFLVMEYVDGKDLGAIQRGLEARRRRLPFDLALHVGAELCEALEHAHMAKAPDGKPMSLVHRDISPSNVLLSRAGEVKLTDFGIAKRAEQEATRSGAVRGKFAYISPEQAKNEGVTPKSDVFSVGILMWELVTNRRLFSGLQDLEALRAVRESKIQRPREIDGTLDPGIDTLIMAALSRDVSKRPTAGQLGQKLRSLRYALEVTVGDPATELAKIIDGAEEVERQSQQMMAPPRPSGFDSMDPGEMTVIRIRTADAFSAKDNVAQARKVIDGFEEEQTRQAQLTGDQLKILRRNAPRDSAEMTAEAPPPLPLPGVRRAHRETEEPTVARSPIVEGTPTPKRSHALPNQHMDSDEHTRLVAPRDRRTPIPERMPRAVTAPGSRSQPGLPLPPAPATPTPFPPAPTMPLDRQPPMGPPPMPPSMNAPMTLPPSGPQEPPPGTVQMRPQQMRPMEAPQPGTVQMPPQPAMGPPPMMMGAPPHLQQQMPMQPQMPMPPQPQPQQGWAPPRMPAPQYPQAPRPSQHPMGQTQHPRAGFVKPWMLVVGALVMAGLAFGMTRACIGPGSKTAASSTDK